MSTKIFLRILGFGLLLVGVVGFFAPHLLGMHLTGWHNVIHLASGALALYFGYPGSSDGARVFAMSVGLAYLGLGLLGFVAPGLTASLLGHEPVSAGELAPDNVVHIVIGGAFLLASRARARVGEREPATGRVRRT
jgi:hypothetical protein